MSMKRNVLVLILMFVCFQVFAARHEYEKDKDIRYSYPRLLSCREMSALCGV